MEFLIYLPMLLPIFAIIGMIYISNFTSEKDLFRVSWDKLAQFMAFLGFIFVLRLLREDFFVSNGLAPVPLPPVGEMWTLGLVFWEDFFFAIPIYYICKHMKNKWFKFVLILLISTIFGLGHIYQGWGAAFVLALMPYFVTYHYGKKYGFGTTMIGHIMYDVSTIMLAKLLPFLLIK